jgi:hypothetical protein
MAGGSLGACGMNWLVTQDEYRWIIKADTLEEASEFLDGILFMTGVVRKDPKFRLIEKRS